MEPYDDTSILDFDKEFKPDEICPIIISYDAKLCKDNNGKYILVEDAALSDKDMTNM